MCHVAPQIDFLAPLMPLKTTFLALSSSSKHRLCAFRALQVCVYVCVHSCSFDVCFAVCSAGKLEDVIEG